MMPKHRIIPVFVPHLGCPNDCVFCNQRRISGSLVPATAETVLKALESAVSVIPAQAEAELAFYGGSFTAIPGLEQELLLGAAQPYLRGGLIRGIRLSTRPDCVNGVTIERLLRFGVTTVELGVQSMCRDVLEKSGRGHTPEDAIAAAGLIKAAGISLILQMMTGLPGDTRERSVDTAKKIVSMAPDGVRIYPTVVIRDTKLFDMWLAGIYKEHTIKEAVALCAELLDLFETSGIPVIRLGLNPTDELSGGSAAAGAYHPAFGELVQSFRYLSKAESLLFDVFPGADVVLGVAKGQVSAATGQKRKNIAELTEKYGLRSLKIREADVKKGEIIRLNIAY